MSNKGDTNHGVSMTSKDGQQLNYNKVSLID